MPYRAPAPAPPKEATPLEKLVVARYGVFPALVIILACIVASGWVARSAYAAKGVEYMIGVAIGGAAFLGVLALVMKRTHVAIDREAGALRIGRTIEHRLVEIASAEVEDIDDSDFFKVLLTMKNGRRVAIAEGRSSDCNALAKAINEATAALSSKRDEHDDDDDAPADSVPEGTWAAAESVLRGVPLDSATIARNAEEQRVDAFVTRRNRQVRLSVDVRELTQIDVTVEVVTGLDVLEVTYDADAKRVVTDEEEEQKVLDALPDAIRERITRAVSTGQVDTLCIFGEETMLTLPASAAQTRASLDEVLDLAVDVAAHAATVPAKAE